MFLIDIIIFITLPNLCFSCVNINRTFNLKNIEKYKLIINNKDMRIKIPKNNFIYYSKNKNDLYIKNIDNKYNLNNIDIFPYFVFK